MWAVTSSLISAGVRKLHPNQIISLFKSLVVPKLLYGVELIRLSDSARNFLDRQARCALKSMLDVSKFSKNLIDKLYNISLISSLLDSKRLSLLNELVVNANTRQYVLHVLTLNENDRSFSFITEINNTCINYNIDILDCIVNRKSIKINNLDLTDDVLQLRDCIDNWHIYEYRKRFKEILESSIIR